MTRTWARTVEPAGDPLSSPGRSVPAFDEAVPPSAENGVPGATRMPAASRRTRAVRSSWTGSQSARVWGTTGGPSGERLLVSSDDQGEPPCEHLQH